MERLFIETKYEGTLELPKELIDQLPNKIVLAMPIQFLDFQESIKEQLKDKEVTLLKSKHGKHPGQVLGCDVHKQEGKVEAFLYIGDGKFHPTALLYKNDQPVYCYNPFNKQIEVLDNDYLSKIKQKKKGQLLKFLQSDTIGILTTTKFGQNQTKQAEQLRTKLEKEGKTVFIFLADEINFQSLENFNFIQSWVNTACPRIIEDFNCINIEDIVF
jgi:2-(3-amino-3-carboxypropyl)histidine synthase